MQGNARDGSSSARGGRGSEIVIENEGEGGGGGFLMVLAQPKSRRGKIFAIIVKFMPYNTLQIKKQK